MTELRIVRLRKILCIGIGIFLILGAVSMYLSRVIKKNRLIADHADYVSRMESLLPEREAGFVDRDSQKTMKSFSLDGLSFAGILTYRNCEKLPVYTLWEGKGVNGRPAVYSGSIYNGTLVIGGEDREGELAFAESCDAGEQILFTDVFGKEFSFTIRKIEHSSSVSEENLHRDNDPLVLFARTGIREYIIIRCS